MGFGILFLAYGIDTGDTFGHGMAAFFIIPGILLLVFKNGWVKFPHLGIKSERQETPQMIKAPTYIYIISGVLGFIAAQIRMKIGAFDDNHLLAIAISSIIVYLFFYRKYKDKKIGIYYIAGAFISYLVTILFAAFFISTLL
jgi:hypothetical protein